jgi:glycosyltransferase involved in cell wall biosynthesis
LPTRGRPQYATQAVKCFLSQTYPHRELIILDDADDPSFPSDIHADGVEYLRLDQKLNIPQKRNKCCEMAKGEVVAHFDSDDWSAPNRLEVQMEMMRYTHAAMCGFNTMLFYDTQKGTVHKYWGAANFIIGTSMVYTKQWWQDHRWNESKAKASDNLFWRVAAKEKQIVVQQADGLLVARIHSENTAVKRVDLSPYKKASLEELPNAFPR